jgi:hypothetical protein
MLAKLKFALDAMIMGRRVPMRHAGLADRSLRAALGKRMSGNTSPLPPIPVVAGEASATGEY